MPWKTEHKQSLNSTHGLRSISIWHHRKIEINVKTEINFIQNLPLRCLALPSIPTSRAAKRSGTLRHTPLPGTSQKVANCSITHKLMSVYNAEVTQQRQRARSGGKGGRERSLAEGTKLIRPASVLPMRPLHATAAAANVAAVLNAVLPSPPSSSPSSAQSAAALPLQNQPCLRRLSVVMLVQIARRGTREGGRRILCGMHGRVQIKRSEEGLRKEKREGEMGLVCERASESATHMYAYVVHYLLQSADKIKRKASDRWTDADGPWTDRRTEQRVVTRGGDSGRERPREGE